MIISTLTKTVVGAGTVLGALTLSETSPISYSTKQNNKRFDEKIAIKTLDDVELLESKGGCTISFIDSFKDNKSYRAKQFYSIVQPKEKGGKKWDEKIIWAAQHYYDYCKPGVFIPFAYNNDNTQKFFIKEQG